MRSILEQAIVHQLNGEADKAQNLFHQFVVARARQIHESMRNGEDPLVEGWDEEVNADTYFTEEDLADLEDGGGEVDGEDDFGAEDDLADEDMDTVDMDDDLGAELDAHEEEDQELADEVDELSAKLAELEAKFAELSGEDDDMEGDDDFAPMDDDTGVSNDMEDDFGGDEFDAEDEDDFDRLGESVTSELEKVSVTMQDGDEVAAGGKITQNKTSPIPQKKIGERQGGKPVELKSSNHSGFERETAPTVADMKKRRNTMKKATEQQSSVKGGAEKGEGKELGGKTVAKNTKSPLSGVSKK